MKLCSMSNWKPEMDCHSALWMRTKTRALSLIQLRGRKKSIHNSWSRVVPITPDWVEGTNHGEKEFMEGVTKMFYHQM